MLVAVPLEATEQTTERSVKLIGVDLLVRLSDILEDLADVLGNLCGLAHIDFGSLKLGCGIVERQTVETAADLALLEGCENDPALALLASATRAAKTVDVGFAVARKTDLDDMADIGKIHSSSLC